MKASLKVGLLAVNKVDLLALMSVAMKVSELVVTMGNLLVV